MSRIKKISMQDIADKVGVSKNCVSLALNNKRGVSDELRERILKAAREMNYAGLGLQERSKSTKNILVLAPEYVMSDRVFYPVFIWEIEKYARSQGYNAIFTGISVEMERQLTLPRLLYDMDYQGLVVLGVLKRAYIEKLFQFHRKLVMVDTHDSGLYCNTVITENIHGASMAVNYLIQQGHRDIGFIGPIEKTSSNYERWIGFNNAMEASKLPVSREYCLLQSSDFSCTEEEIDHFVHSLSSMPTVWFCANDLMASSLIHVMSKYNIKVPEQVSIVGFDDAEIASLVIPKLTTVRVKRDAICKQAIHLLIGESESQMDAVKISVYGELVIRDSVKSITPSST